MPKIHALQLSKHLQKTRPQPVYAVVGGDDALRARSRQALEEFAAPPDQPGSTVRRFQDAPGPADLFGELRTVPFMGMQGRRVAVVEAGGEFLKEHGDRVLAYMEHPSPTATLILMLDGIDGRTKIGKALRDSATVVDCGKVSWNDARTWAQDYARGEGKRLSRGAAYALVEAQGPNLLALQNELEKLLLYVADRDTITEDDVGEMSAHARSRSVFDLGQAVADGKVGEALRLCDELLLRGEAKEAIVAVLARQLSQYWQVKRLHHRGAPEREIAREAGMPPFAVRRAVPLAERLSDRWFAERLHILSNADFESKTESLRAGEEEVWLQTLLARLCSRKQAG